MIILPNQLAKMEFYGEQIVQNPVSRKNNHYYIFKTPRGTLVRVVRKYGQLHKSACNENISIYKGEAPEFYHRAKGNI